jgi:hypothetical protein
MQKMIAGLFCCAAGAGGILYAFNSVSGLFSGPLPDGWGFVAEPVLDIAVVLFIGGLISFLAGIMLLQGER